MQTEDLGGSFVVAVEDVSGVWSTIKPLLEENSVLRDLEFQNKFGKRVKVPSIEVKYMLSSDPELVRLRPHSQNPVAWFRNPYAHLIVVSCEELTDYKAGMRTQLRGLLEREKDPVLGMVEWVVLYVRPLRSDVQSRGPKRVFERLKDDFNTKKRERCVRLDTPVMSSTGVLNGPLEGMAELETFIKESVRLSFESRQTAYENEVRRLMATRMEPGWSFPNLFLVKDSLAIMLEAAGLQEDALREYFELEACYLEGIEEGGAMAGLDFGGNAPGDDVATLLTASWRETRRAVLNYGSVSQFNFRQFLFARQARLLMSLNRPLELADRSMKFIQTFSMLLQEREESGHIVHKIREVWVFSACLSVANVTYQAMLGTESAAKAAALPRRHSAQDVPELGAALARSVAGGATSAPPSRFHLESRDDSRVGLRTSLDTPRTEDGGSPGKQSPVVGQSIASSPTTRASSGTLKPIRTRSSSTQEPSDATAVRMDWDIGLLPALHAEQLKIVNTSAAGGVRIANSPESLLERKFYCALGHLYSSARSELMKLGDGVGLQSRIQQSPFSSASVGAGSPVTMQPPSSPRAPTNRHSAALPPPISTTTSLGRAALRSPAQRPSTSATTPTGRSASPGFRRFASTFAAWNHSEPKTPDLPASKDVAAPAEAQPAPKPSSTVVEDSGRGGDAGDGSHTSQEQGEKSGGSSRTGERGLSLMEEAEARSPPPTYDEETHQTFAKQASAAAAELELDSQGGQAQEASPEPTARRPSLDLASPPANGAGMEVPLWLTEWRLLQALGDRELFEELFVQLSTAASTCYTLCGRWRNASIMQADVGALLLKTGKLEAATAIFQYQAQVFLKEGWHALLAQVLPKLITCYKATKHPALPHWIVQLQSLPSGLMLMVDRVALQRELVLACERAPVGNITAQQIAQHLQSKPIDPQLSRVRVPAAHIEPGDSPCILDALDMLVLTPAPGKYTRYYGREDTLSPGGDGKSAQLSGGGQSICVGDVVSLEAEVSSFLPQTLTLWDVTLTLSVLEMPRSSFSGRATTRRRGSRTDRGLVAEQAQLQCSLDGSPAEGKLVLHPGTNRIRFSAYPVQEGLCVLKHLSGRLGHMLVVATASKANPASLSCAFSLPSSSAPEASLEEAGPHTPAAQVGMSPFSPVPCGGVNLLEGSYGAFQSEDAEVAEEQVLLAVSRAESRVQVSAVGFRGAIFAGQRQWLGICLRPWHDTLGNATLQIGTSHRPSGSSFPTSITLPKRSCHATVVPLDGPAEGEGAGRAEQQQVEGTLVRISGGTLKLPAWTARQPSLVWIWVTAGEPDLPAKTIRMSNEATGPRRLQHQPMASMPRIATLGRVPSRQHSTEGSILEPEGQAEVEVEVRYTSGCNRSHSCILSVPVLPPFRMEVMAHRMSNGRIVMELHLVSLLVQTAIIRKCQLELQSGLILEASWMHVAGLLPCVVSPKGSVKLLYFVRQTPEGEAEGANDELHERFTTLEAEYEIMAGPPLSFPREVAAEFSEVAEERLVRRLPPEHPPEAHSSAAAVSDSMRSLVDSQREVSDSQRSLDMLSEPSGPMRRSLDDGDGAGAEGSGRSATPLQMFCQSFSIDTGIKEVSPEMEVLVRMLGPFTLFQGQQVHFCWRLERAGALATTTSSSPPTTDTTPSSTTRGAAEPDTAPPSVSGSGLGKPSRLGGAVSGEGANETEKEGSGEVIQYEIHANGEAWRMAGSRRGQICLPRSLGATATIEAAWTPLLEGHLPLPQLQLRGVAWREGSSPWHEMVGDTEGGAFEDVSLEAGGVQTHCTVLPASGASGVRLTDHSSKSSIRSAAPTAAERRPPATTHERPPLSRSSSLARFASLPTHKR